MKNAKTAKLRDAVQAILGVVVIVAGVTLWSKPAALCLAGAALLADVLWARRIG